MSGLNHIVHVLTWDHRTWTGGSGIVRHIHVRFKLFMYLLETSLHELVVLVLLDMYKSGLNHIVYVLTWDQRTCTGDSGVVWHVHAGLNHIVYVLTWEKRTCTGGSGVVWHVYVRFNPYCLCTYLRQAYMYMWFWCSFTCTFQV